MRPGETPGFSSSRKRRSFVGCRRTSRRCRRAETGAGPCPDLGPRAATRRALTIDPAFFAASHRSKHKERASESCRRKPQWTRLYSELKRPHGSRARLEGDLCAGIAGTARPLCAAARLCVPQLLEGTDLDVPGRSQGVDGRQSRTRSRLCEDSRRQGLQLPLAALMGSAHVRLAALLTTHLS